MIGRVVSIKMKNTAAVLVERIAKHPLYGKTFVRSKKYLAEDMIGTKVGDIVNLINCKPISKRKAWKVEKVLGKDFVEVAKIQLKKEAEEVITEIMPEEKETEESSAVSPQTEKEAVEKQKRTRKKKGESDS